MEPTEELSNAIEKGIAQTGLLRHFYLPSLIPLKGYATPFDGAYHTGFLPHHPLVKTSNKKQKTLLSQSVDRMAPVYEAVKAAQDTGWRINTRVLHVAKRLWNDGMVMPGLPPRDDEFLPHCPKCGRDLSTEQENHPCFTSKETLKIWKNAAREVHRRNHALRSKRLLVHNIFWIAEMYENDESFYFPYQVDFRGRFYTLPQCLTPQGCDLSKGLLEFAGGKPINTQEAEDWLAIHLANTRGRDKLSLEERIAWVHRNTATFERMADDPFSDVRWATKAKHPFAFLAACIDWVNYKRTGRGYISHIPVAQDGSCSGLQHFSAMLRDEFGAAETNLLPFDEPKDIYRTIAERTVKKLEAVSVNDVSYHYAQRWIKSGLIDRSLAKGPVMTFPYGATQVGTKREIMTHVEAAYMKNPRAFAWAELEIALVCRYLSKIMREVIVETVIAAPKVMEWLQGIADTASTANIPLIWATPTGMPVVQEYFKEEMKRISILLTGEKIPTFKKGEAAAESVSSPGQKRIDLSNKTESDRIDKRSQKKSIAPNFVHSMDASAMVLAVQQAKESGIHDFSLIHDSFGTHAADSGLLAEVLRDAFVRMYEDHDVLSEFMTQIKEQLSETLKDNIQLPPQKGTLDLNLVRKAKYFFA